MRNPLSRCLRRVTERSGVQRHRQNHLRKNIGSPALRAYVFGQCVTDALSGQTQRKTTLESLSLSFSLSLSLSLSWSISFCNISLKIADKQDQCSHLPIVSTNLKRVSTVVHDDTRVTRASHPRCSATLHNDILVTRDNRPQVCIMIPQQNNRSHVSNHQQCNYPENNPSSLLIKIILEPRQDSTLATTMVMSQRIFTYDANHSTDQHIFAIVSMFRSKVCFEPCGKQLQGGRRH